MNVKWKKVVNSFLFYKPLTEWEHVLGQDLASTQASYAKEIFCLRECSTYV